MRVLREEKKTRLLLGHFLSSTRETLKIFPGFTTTEHKHKSTSAKDHIFIFKIGTLFPLWIQKRLLIGRLNKIVIHYFALYQMSNSPSLLLYMIISCNQIKGYKKKKRWFLWIHSRNNQMGT